MEVLRHTHLIELKFGTTLYNALKMARKAQLEHKMLYGEYYTNIYMKPEIAENGANIRGIQERLGHSDVTITLNKYVHNTDSIKNECVDIFESIATL